MSSVSAEIHVELGENGDMSVFREAGAFTASWPLGTVDYLGACSCPCLSPCRVLGSG